MRFPNAIETRRGRGSRLERLARELARELGRGDWWHLPSKVGPPPTVRQTRYLNEIARDVGLPARDLLWLAVDLGRVRLTRDCLISGDVERMHAQSDDHELLRRLNRDEVGKLFPVVHGTRRLLAYGRASVVEATSPPVVAVAQALDDS